MAQPNWVTGSGSLGTIPEGKFYRATLEAYDPDFPSDATKVKYFKLSGDLPQGIQITENGKLEGTPKTYVQGVPGSVSQNIKSKFAVRAYTQKIVNGSLVTDKINDRTFSLTITGQDVPDFTTPAGSLGNYFDGQLVNTQITYSDSDLDDTISITLASGELPPGVSVSSSGLIYGYIEPAETLLGYSAGWETTGFDSLPLQFNSGTVSKTYSFTLKISDGKDYNLRTYSIYVGVITADSNAYTVDSSTVTADTVTRAPYIDNYVEDLGSFSHLNYFIHQFEGKDPNGDILNYSVSGTLPTGLSLDTNTGYLHGNLSNIGLTEIEYSFSISVYKKENPLSSNKFDFKITIVGSFDKNVTWNSNENLGTLNNGEISTLYVSATANNGSNVQYRLKTNGTNNKLPQGLILLSSGNLAGRVSYKTFGLYDRQITADSDTAVDTTLVTTDNRGNEYATFDSGTTTFDSKYQFTVEAYNAEGVSSTKSFYINVNREYDTPLQDIKIKTLMSSTDRSTVNTLLESQDIMTPSSIYRPNDPYFGVAEDVSFTHLYGLSPDEIKHYVESMENYHYNKRVTLGGLETAKAIDENGDTVYEVVYSRIIDNIEDVEETVSTEVGDVYPNSLNNMRTSVINKVGKISKELPLWMTSKQDDGTVLGYTKAWVIVYTNPGLSNTIAYNINKSYKNTLNKLNVVIDRYILNGKELRTWDSEDFRWTQHVSTTFDIYEHSYSVDKTDITADTTSNTADQFDNTSTQTIFDGDSTKFIEVEPYTADITMKTADTIDISTDGGYRDYKIYTKTDKFDQYLLFPDKDIINSK